MLTVDIIQHVNDLTDENYSNDTVLKWLNSGMARINAEVNANFPSLTLTPGEEPVIPEKWQHLLLVPFAAGRVKQMDSSQFEYEDLFGEFESNLQLFKTNYLVPEDYQEEGSAITSDVYTSPPSPDWSW